MGLSGRPRRAGVPRSISALLTARLDRLETDERHVLERAAIVGQVFYPSALVALSEGESRRPLDQILAALVGRQLIGSTASTFADEPAYEFLHILIRDAAYQGILKRRRADLHERFARWVETEAGIRTVEQSEIIGYHLEQAAGYLGELGPLNDRGRATALRGAEHLAAAGHRAFGRGDMPAAGKLLRRAASLRPSGDAERRRLLLESGEALTEAGEFGPAHDVLAAAIDESQAAGDTVFATTAAVVELHRSYATEGADEASVLAELDRSLAVVEAAGDDAGLARAYRLLTLVHWTALRNGLAERAARRSIEHARRAGDTIMEVRFLPSLVMSARSGPTPASQGIDLAESLLPRVGDDSKGLALILSVLANLKAMRGEVDVARDLYQRSRALLIEHGWKLYAALTSLDLGPVEFLAGDPLRAEAELRADFETLEPDGRTQLHRDDGGNARRGASLAGSRR